MGIPCQALYNLRNTSSWISGQDLHKLFCSLVEDPSPSGNIEFNKNKLLALDKIAYHLLFKCREFTIIKISSGLWSKYNKNNYSFPNGMSFYQAFKICQKYRFEENMWGKIEEVPNMLGKIIDSDRFYKEQLITNDDGMTWIKDRDNKSEILLTSCRWINYEDI